jgi:hypothetical protein
MFLEASTIFRMPTQRRYIPFTFCLGNAFAELLNLAVIERFVFAAICGDGVCVPCCGIA